MKRLLINEWRRLLRNPVNLMALALLFVILSVTAALSGMAASEQRARMHDARQRWVQTQKELVQTARNAKPTAPAPLTRPANPEQFVPSAGAGIAPNQVMARLPALAQREPSGGLVLSVRAFELLSPEVRASARVRYVDGRNIDHLYNPLLQTLGGLDLAGMTALLVPLIVVALSFGLVLEERERGIWRQLCSLSPQPWKLLASALVVRFVAVFGVAFVATAIGFAFDTGAHWGALFDWMLVLAGMTLSWTLIAALFSLSKLSSAASAAGLVGIWALLSFALPAVINVWAEQQHPVPSSMAMIVEVRSIQQEANDRGDDVIAQWFAQNPQHTPPAKPSVFVGRTARALGQDTKIRPLVYAIEKARADRLAALERWAFLSPAMSALVVADRLAGSDAASHFAFVQQTNQHEDAWRSALVPSIMTDTLVSADQLTRVPAPMVSATGHLLPWHRLLVWLPALVLLPLCFGLRQRAAIP